MLMQNRGSGSSGYTMDFAGNVTVSEVLTVDVGKYINWCGNHRR